MQTQSSPRLRSQNHLRGYSAVPGFYAGLSSARSSRRHTPVTTTYPAIGSLWNPNRLDLLKSPLTRYHE